MRKKLKNYRKFRQSSYALLISAGIVLSSPLHALAVDYDIPGENVTTPVHIENTSEFFSINYAKNDTPAVQSGDITGLNGSLVIEAPNNGTLLLRGTNTGFSGTIIFNSGTLNIADNKSLFANMGEFLFQSGTSSTQIPTLQINSGANIIIDSTSLLQKISLGRSRVGRIELLDNAALTFSNAKTTDQGGVFFIGTFSLLELASETNARYIFTNNSAADGGVARIYEGTLTVSQADFLNNTATSGRGGAIYIETPSSINQNGRVELTNVNFSNNTAKSFGGSIYNSQGTVTIDGGDFSKNAAGSDGGAIYNQEAELNLTDVSFTNNTAGWNGGRFFNGMAL